LNDPSLIVSSHARAALAQVRNEPSDSFTHELTSGAKSVDALRAASVLYALGTNGNWISAQLIIAAGRSKDSERFDVLNFLCANELEPAVAWPIILLALEDKWRLRANALNAAIIQLGRGSSSAKWRTRAHAAIVGCLADKDVNVKANAIAALSTSYPQDANLVPPTVLNTLANDPNPGIRAWAEALQKQLIQAR
jgi:hypothetical protein